MTCSEYCVNRPVFTIVLMLLLMITGAIYYSKLPIRHLPNINKPTVTIITEFDGASPELIEKEITIPIENKLGSIAGIDTLRSVSLLGKSKIIIDFQLGIDVTETLSEVRNKLSILQNRFPAGTEAPLVSKSDTDANPVLLIGFHDTTKNSLEITDFINRHIKPLIQEVQGVGEVVDHGARDYAVKIELDPLKMAARHITVAEVKKALIQQNIDIPSGQIKSNQRYYTIVTHARLQTTKKFSDLVIAQHNHQFIRLNDVATVSVGSQNEDNLLRINGKSAVGLAILAQSTANPMEVAKALKQTLSELQSIYPPTFKASIIFDSTRYIQESIHEVYHAFWETIICVGLVVLLFLGSLRAAIIPIITIPICLISVFWPMSWFGFELNTLTLLAIVLAIGLVVDDAIVVLENCHRHIQNGLLPFPAAIKGTNEIILALLTMTVTLAAVYAPMGFINGFTGKLFLQFGTTLALCVIVSGIIALTLSPMMCARLLTNKEGNYSRWLNHKFKLLSELYYKSLNRFIQVPAHFLMLLTVVCILGGISYYRLGTELAPVEDQSYIVGPVSSPTNSSTAYTNHYVSKLETIYDKIPEGTAYMVSIRPTSAFTLLQLSPWNSRKRSQQTISQELREKMQNLTGVNAFPVKPNPLGPTTNNNQFSFSLMSNSSYAKLNETSNGIVKLLMEFPELKQIKNNLALDNEQIDIEINRQLAADLDVNLADIAELITTMLGGSNPVNFNYDGQTYKVILQLNQELRRDVTVLNTLYVKSKREKMIPLSSLIHVGKTLGPEDLPHLNRFRSANITAELADGYYLGQVVKKTEQVLQDNLPDGYQFRFTGLAKDFLESSTNSSYAFLLAILFIYLVLAAQFESFIDPLIVLLTVPLCLTGALIALYLTHQTLSIYSNIGMVTLIGLITKHGIMLTEFANKQVEQGVDKYHAVLEGAQIRLRPILMTTLAMMLGALPLALASGAGAESRRQLGIVILGGMSIGTFFSLYIVPFAYIILSRRKPR